MKIRSDLHALPMLGGSLLLSSAYDEDTKAISWAHIKAVSPAACFMQVA